MFFVFEGILFTRQKTGTLHHNDYFTDVNSRTNRKKQNQAILPFDFIIDLPRRAEQEVLLRRCSIYSDDKLKIRHSFFRRSKKGSHGYGASHSRESSDSRGDEAGSSIGSNTFANGKQRFFINFFIGSCITLSQTLSYWIIHEISVSYFVFWYSPIYCVLKN